MLDEANIIHFASDSNLRKINVKANSKSLVSGHRVERVPSKTPSPIYVKEKSEAVHDQGPYKNKATVGC